MGRTRWIIKGISIKSGRVIIPSDGMALIMVLMAALVHCVLAILFGTFGATPLLVSNAAMVFFYLVVCVGLLHLGKVGLVLWAEFIAILIHSLYAVVLVGWNYGFTYWFLGMTPMSFLVFYSYYKSELKFWKLFFWNFVILLVSCFVKIAYAGKPLIEISDPNGMLAVHATVINLVSCTIACSLSAALTIYRAMVDEKELKERENAKAANEAKTQFLTNMSHEIRTPINAMLGLNEMILRDAKDEVIIERASDVKRAGDILVSLISDIIDFSNIESNKVNVSESEYKLENLIRDSYMMIEDKLTQKKLNFTVRNDKSIPGALIGDVSRIRQVLVNLLVNAVKYTDNGGIVLDIAYDVADEVTGDINLKLSVIDTGFGMSKDEIESVFDSFSRGIKAQSMNIEGIGLGLAITKRITELMNGSIEVESTEGVGSKFTVIIPQGVSAHKAVGDLSAAYKKRENVAEKRVEKKCKDCSALIVDDVPINIKVVKGLLSKTGIKTESALSGEECLKMVKEKNYDIILLDHMMPGMDGLEVWERFKTPEYNIAGNTPVIMMTANALIGEKESYLSMGFSDYIPKPVNVEELLEKVFKHIPADKIVSKE